jgi:hypothetical protein
MSINLNLWVVMIDFKGGSDGAGEVVRNKAGRNRDEANLVGHPEA